MKKENLYYTQGDISFVASLYFPDSSGKKPAVLIFPTWAGKDSFIEEKAAYLASLGYIGIAIDMYGEEKTGSSKEENASLMEPLIKDRTLLQKRALAAFEAAKKINSVSSIGAIGFCFGGLCSLDLARSEPSLKASISIHGGLLPPPSYSYGNIAAKILVLHGYNDPMVPPDQVLSFTKEMEEKKADWQVHIYGNTMHAFTNPKANDPSFGTVYQPTSCKRAFFLLESFLKESFS